MPAHPIDRALWAAYAFLWLGGVGNHVLNGRTPPNMAWAAPLFLALAAVIALRSEWPRWQPAALAAALGLLAEIVGVASGYPFGAYSYTTVLVPQIFGVPLVVAGAWMILFVYVRQMRFGIALSALSMAALDLVIDPLAANVLDFWRWDPLGPYYGVPLINFAGWFAVSLAIFARAPRLTRLNPQGVWLGTTIVLFFAAIAAVHGYFFPAVLGAAISGFGYFRFMRSMASTIT